MKTKLFLSVLLSFTFYLLSSQVPQGFNYQAQASDQSGSPIRNTTLQAKISILSDTITPVTVWEELHSVVKTNPNGIFSLVVGSGVRQPASSATLFKNINWSATQMFIKTQIYYQGVWKSMGSAKLWTVPYAMVSGSVSGKISKLGVNGLTTSPDSALFEVKNASGQTVFVVYNEGVRMYVDNGAKGSKGGFAIGGFGSAKAASQEYMRVTGDSTRIYVNETAAKGSKGGFAIGGFNSAKGTSDNFLKLTPSNYFVGHKSGNLITSGVYNSTLGFESGKALTTGSSNVFLGYKSGWTNTIGSNNIFIGKESGYANISGDYNILLGNWAGYDNTTGWGNIMLGDHSGTSNTTGYQNVILGDLAGYLNDAGAQNVFIGASSGYSNTSGSYNSFVGAQVGKNNTSGDYNTFFGYQAGYSSGLSSYSTSIGYKAGFSLSNWQAGTYVGYEAGLQSTGRQNVFVGSDAGQAFTTGADNVVLGAGAGSSNDSPVVVQATGSRNSFIGYYTGYKPSGATDNVLVGAQDPFGATHITGSYNVYLGVNAGNLSAAASRNVFIGYEAGKNETGSDKLYIQNSSLTPLLWGDFSLRRLRLNGNTSINGTLANQYFALEVNIDANDTYGLVVYGPTWCSSGVWSGSDIRLKKNITPLSNSLSNILALNGVNFDWRRDEFPQMGLSDTRQIGLIAQDVEKVLPLLVNEGPNGYLSVDYSKIAPVLVEAVKEQQKIIESQKSELDALKTELAQIKAILVRNNLK
jgi:hypothetical protein